MTEVHGVIAAAITPRTPQGDINLGAAFELVDYLCKAGVHGIALFTPTGESGAVTPDERSRLVYLAVKRSRVPLLAGVGAGALDISVGLARGARDAGVGGVLLPPPGTMPHDPDDLREFYRQFASQTGPGAAIFLSGDLELDAAVELLQTGHFAGIEHASDAFDCWRNAAAAHHFPLFCGNDTLLSRSLNSGARGVISPVACAVPEVVVALHRSIAGENAAETARLETLLGEFLAWTAQLPRIAVLKAAAEIRGIKAGPPPVPLAPARRRKLDEFREWFRAWLPAIKKLSANA
ncbi:MAG TPA: dihydrodipicolinate synthase family protein [Bryobacteraceae bacterium]|jgi:4-hydroxy-tetrahydrodipicolinate synthase